MSLHIQRTRRFHVISFLEDSETLSFPVIDLSDLLLHEKRGQTDSVRSKLLDAFYRYSFCFLSTPKDSQPAAIIQALKESLHNDIFPHKVVNTHLPTLDDIYISEKDVPMYHLGYEQCQEREIFRVAGSQPQFACEEKIWIQGLGLCRHVCDVALSLLLNNVQQQEERPHSVMWTKPPSKQQKYRPGDFSVFYAMHYFNDGSIEQAVAPHVDPSLLVCEPFLCTETTGLQVYHHHSWIDMDGPNSPVALLWNDFEILLLFAGKGLTGHDAQIKPTLHRVVTGHLPRRCVIYEQKYIEFYE
jgi:hypothetical protein